MTARLDLVGQRFGRLTVHSFAHADDGRTWWSCQCDCGQSAIVRAGALRRGVTRSCGCLSRELLLKRTRTHGMAGTPESRSWKSAIQRCYNTRSRAFKNYGARGITMCVEWRNDFAAFYRDMGPRPSNTTLDRINNDGNYEPGNCRWATPKEQARNRTWPLPQYGKAHSERMKAYWARAKQAGAR